MSEAVAMMGLNLSSLPPKTIGQYNKNLAAFKQQVLHSLKILNIKIHLALKKRK